MRFFYDLDHCFNSQFCFLRQINISGSAFNGRSGEVILVNIDDLALNTIGQTDTVAKIGRYNVAHKGEYIVRIVFLQTL